MPDIEIEIDGKKINTQPGKMIIQVADENGIYIPRFCYHKKLSIAANCRMCLVEVEKAPKTLPACATPINAGMKVFTQSKKTLESQRAVMEFLLINHPLDCPICDQGGQCELQDFSMSYGNDHSAYQEEKRAVSNDNFGPLIATQMTRCIHCTRCVRFGKEIAGVREIGMTGRGEHAQITTYVRHTVDHELSGNIIDLCPVGALLSKPFLYQARPWELKAIASIAAHDGLGSHISVHTRRGQVMRVTPRDHEAINENWLSDRDRFSYQGLSIDRLEKPLIKDKTSGQWREVSWSSALNYVADALQKIKAVQGGNAIGALLSANSTIEEAYLLKQLCDYLGSEQIEYRLKQAGDPLLAPTLPLGLPISIAAIENQKNIILVGSHVRNDQPLLAHRIRKAALQGAQVHVIDSIRHPYTFDLTSETIVKPSEFAARVSSCCDLITESSLIIMGEYAIHHPDAEIIYASLAVVADKTQSILAVLPQGANALGCHQVGAWISPEKKNHSPLKAYLLHGIEPEFDVANPQKCEHDLLAADLVVAVTPFISEHLKKVTQVLLPSAAFTETSGTLINLTGQKQSFMGCVPPKGEARPAWKIYRVLGNLLGVTDFEFDSSEDVLKKMIQERPLHHDFMHNIPKNIAYCTQGAAEKKFLPTPLCEKGEIERITLWPDCRSDALVRRASALNQRAQAQRFDTVHIHSETAHHLQLSDNQRVYVIQGTTQIMAEITFNNQVMVGVASIAGGTTLAAQLEHSSGIIEIIKC